MRTRRGQTWMRAAAVFAAAGMVAWDDAPAAIRHAGAGPITESQPSAFPTPATLGSDALALTLISPLQRGLSYGTAAGDCRQSRDIEKKVHGCTILLEREAGNVITYFRRAEAYQEMDHHSAAIADFSVAIRLDPAYAHAYLGRARSHQAKGNLAAAIADFSTAIKLNQVFARAYVGRAMALEAAGRLAEAVADYRAALGLDAGYEEANAALARLGKSAAGR